MCLTCDFAWDENKRQANITKHGVDFTDAALILADDPLIWKDSREEYGEQRCIAIGERNDLHYVVVFTPRDGACRIISARRANARERKRYAAERNSHTHDPA